MSQLRITAVEGLRTQEEADSMWEDFYSEEEEQKQMIIEEDKAEAPVENETTYEEDSKDVEDKVEEDKSRDMPRLNINLDSTPSNNLPEMLDNANRPACNKKPPRKGKGRKLKTASNSRSPPLNLYQDPLPDRLQYSRDRSTSFNQEAMSDQEVGRRRGRKLHRRGQMKKYYSLEQKIEQAGRDRLEQKYVELEELMMRPLVDSHKVNVPAQQVWWSSKKQQHPIKSGFNKNKPGQRMGAWMSDSTLGEEEGTDRQAYSTICKLRTAKPGLNTQSGNTNQHTATRSENNVHQSQHNSRLTSKPPIPLRKKPSVESLPSTSSGISQPRNDSDHKPQENGTDLSCSKEEDNKFGDVSPRSVYLPVDMHLKYTDNPKLQEWLRQKNIEYRQARKAERAKKREEQSEKQAELDQKAARREKSAERVKQWMEMKRKEAARQQKEERRRKKQEAQEQAAQKVKSAESGVRGNQIDRPQSAPTAKQKYIPIKRPDSAARLENGAYTAPKPPDTKFVYKRPVSGRVRLMKMQNERYAKAHHADQKRLEELTAEEKEKKMRLSYDAWLIAKRKEDTEKHKEAKRQKDLIKSDPEMDRLIPELAIRRIEKISREKKNIDTGVDIIDDDVNKCFGGGMFGKDEEKMTLKDHDSVPEPSSYNLTVEGSVSTLVELNTRAKPTVAKTRMPIPQSALSPRRPQSAKPSRDSSPKVRAIMDTDHMAEPNPFKLDFSDGVGAPLHGRQVQERIFSKQLASELNDNKRPEPQGCASEEPASCPKGADIPKADSFPKGVDSSLMPETTHRSSLVLLQQIEAAAIQSEQEEKLMRSMPEETSATSVEQTPNTETVEEPEDSTKPVLSTDISADAECNKMDAEGKPDEGCSSQEQEQKQQDKKEKTDENEHKEEPSSEENSHKELKEPDSFTSSIKEQQHSEEQITTTEPDVPEGNPKDLQGMGENNYTQEEQQDSEAEDTPGRSMKRVSFSEDLATVFEPSPPETSSSFDDERGGDDDQEDPYMCLDHVPDPV